MAPEQDPWSPLLGTWDMTMRHSAMTEPVSGRQHYAPTLDGAYVQLTWTYDHPDFPDAMAMLTPQRWYYFDVRGVTRVFDVQMVHDGWRMVWLDQGFSQRTHTSYDGRDGFEIVGEASADRGATWIYDFTLSGVRIGDPTPD